MRTSNRMAMIATPLAIALAVTPALAASEPSVSDIIGALSVSPNKTRGSRPVTTPPGTTAPATGQTGANQTAAMPTANPPAAGAAHPAPARSASAPASGSINLDVAFATGTAGITPAARRTLDALGQALTSAELSSARIRIEGHTDTTGSRAANQALSQQRAEAAVAYLVHNFSIPQSRLEAVGRGEDALIVNTGPNVSEPRNRVVHVINLGS